MMAEFNLPFDAESVQRWALFLDRDGVINRRLPDAYVKHWAEFEFLPGVPEALGQLRQWFGSIFIVTNQQGIGRGIMPASALQSIHDQMEAELKKAGVILDGIYYCPHSASKKCSCRKPAIGMAEQAKHDHPQIDLSLSVMVGDSPSDIGFGRRAGMYCVMLGPENSVVDPAPDALFEDLSTWVSFVKNELKL